MKKYKFSQEQAKPCRLVDNDPINDDDKWNEAKKLARHRVNSRNQARREKQAKAQTATGLSHCGAQSKSPVSTFNFIQGSKNCNVFFSPQNPA